MLGVFGLRNCGRHRQGPSEFGIHAHLSLQSLQAAAFSPEVPASRVANHVSYVYAWSYSGSTGALARRDEMVLGSSMYGLRIHRVCNKLYHAQPREGTSSRNGQMTTTIVSQREGRRYHKQAHSWGPGGLAFRLQHFAPPYDRGGAVAGFLHQASVSFVAPGLTNTT